MRPLGVRLGQKNVASAVILQASPKEEALEAEVSVGKTDAEELALKAALLPSSWKQWFTLLPNSKQKVPEVPEVQEVG